jgi:aspartyl-tRNA(Asn)/glutamyl-tRNA(Gln) amidotransferase subunit A
MADDRVYRVGAALETLLLAKWGGPLLDQATPLVEEVAQQPSRDRGAAS